MQVCSPTVGPPHKAATKKQSIKKDKTKNFFVASKHGYTSKKFFVIIYRINQSQDNIGREGNLLMLFSESNSLMFYGNGKLLMCYSEGNWYIKLYEVL